MSSAMSCMSGAPCLRRSDSTLRLIWAGVLLDASAKRSAACALRTSRHSNPAPRWSLTLASAPQMHLAVQVAGLPFHSIFMLVSIVWVLPMVTWYHACFTLVNSLCGTVSGMNQQNKIIERRRRDRKRRSQREAMSKLRAHRRASSLCQDCGEDTWMSKSRCQKCHTRAAAYQRAADR